MVTRRPPTATVDAPGLTSESIFLMKSAMWKKLPLKVRLYGITARPAEPIDAPSGSSDAATSVGGTVAAAGTALEDPADGAAGAAGAGAGTGAGAGDDSLEP